MAMRVRMAEWQVHKTSHCGSK